MSMRGRYHPGEDRMLLVVPGANEDVRFWVHRRLWLALYDVLSRIVTEDPLEGVKSPKPLRRTPSEAGDEEAILLQGVGWKREADVVTLVLRSARPPVSVQVGTPAVPRVCWMIESLADQAGWDILAGLERVHADRLATTVVRRART